jgi:hypothetical protein
MQKSIRGFSDQRVPVVQETSVLVLQVLQLYRVSCTARRVKADYMQLLLLYEHQKATDFLVGVDK